MAEPELQFSLEAEIVAVPILTAVTLPELSTVAMLLSLDAHVTPCLSALNCTVSPISKSVLPAAVTLIVSKSTLMLREPSL